jgi:hypothetical protein
MKRVALLVFAALLVLMFSVPAMAMEHQFGGYWRTRFYTQQNFDGTDVEPPSRDWTAVDTRTRLYYTAVFHENLKFVNKFEFDGSWGKSRGGDLWAGRQEGPGNEWTDIGADGANIEIKNSYADFKLGPMFAKVGIQGGRLARGFLIDTDFAGLVVGYQGDGMSIPFMWIKNFEGGQSDNAMDLDYYALAPSFSAGNFTINPYVLYAYSDNAFKYSGGVYEEYNLYWAGLDIDMNFDAFSLWLTGIYSGGDRDFFASSNSEDISGYLGAVGFGFDFGMGDVHGEFFYASGDDDPLDSDRDDFQLPDGRSYYWGEIMGWGMFDVLVPTNSPADGITNVMAANFGASVKPMDKLKISLDAWWAKLAEETGNTTTGSLEDELGVEVDLVITYKLIEGMNLDVVGAYLFAGDAVYNGNDDADPYEIGSRLSLSF